jgi:hypothetical protein
MIDKALEQLQAIRDNLFMAMPTGDIKAWDLIQVVKQHLAELDKYIESDIAGRQSREQEWDLREEVKLLKERVAKVREVLRDVYNLLEHDPDSSAFFDMSKIKRVLSE